MLEKTATVIHLSTATLLDKAQTVQFKYPCASGNLYCSFSFFQDLTAIKANPFAIKSVTDHNIKYKMCLEENFLEKPKCYHWGN